MKFLIGFVIVLVVGGLLASYSRAQHEQEYSPTYADEVKTSLPSLFRDEATTTTTTPTKQVVTTTTVDPLLSLSCNEQGQTHAEVYLIEDLGLADASGIYVDWDSVTDTHWAEAEGYANWVLDQGECQLG